MSYLVLARKWRPQTFENVIGQKPVVRTLQNAIERNRVPHAMLFSGVRGVGKTTLARIMAKSLNCDTGIVKIPCNKCASCTSITDGSSADLHEIDGASNRGIQEIRELKENIRFYPSRDRFKIIIIDEVHMLTTEAFNALLKTLEEPPEHVIFMFATTELHKIPVTILSRCQRYELKRVPANELAVFFRMIAAKENVKISDNAIDMIIREAGGSVRDGLSLLDQVFSFSVSDEATGVLHVTDEDVVQVLGLVGSETLEALARAVLTGDLQRCLTLLDETYSFGIDLKRFVNDLLLYFRALLICKTTQQPHRIIDSSDQEIQSMTALSKDYSPETLYHMFNLFQKSVEQIQYSSQPRITLEIALIKSVQAGNIVPVGNILENLDKILKGEGLQKYGNSIKHPLMSEDVNYKAKTDNEEDIARVKVSEKEREPFSKAIDHSGDANSKMTKEEISGPPEVEIIKTKPKDLRKNWDEFIHYIMDRKKWMAHTLQLCSGATEQDNELLLKFDDQSDFKMLQSSENIKYLTEFAQDFFQKELKVKFKLRGENTPGNEGQEDGLPQEERRALVKDPLVRMVTDVLDGHITNVRTGPRSR